VCRKRDRQPELPLWLLLCFMVKKADMLQAVECGSHSVNKYCVIVLRELSGLSYGNKWSS